MQDSNSDAYSCAGAIDTVISHHQNAPSLTHFDTDNRDFDERLAMVIQVCSCVQLYTQGVTCLFRWVVLLLHVICWLRAFCFLYAPWWLRCSVCHIQSLMVKI